MGLPAPMGDGQRSPREPCWLALSPGWHDAVQDPSPPDHLSFPWRSLGTARAVLLTLRAGLCFAHLREARHTDPKPHSTRRPTHSWDTSRKSKVRGVGQPTHSPQAAPRADGAGGCLRSERQKGKQEDVTPAKQDGNVGKRNFWLRGMLWLSRHGGLLVALAKSGGFLGVRSPARSWIPAAPSCRLHQAA